MKLQSEPPGKQLTWNELLSLPTGTSVRDFEGETGVVTETPFKGRIVKRVEWDDGCITAMSGQFTTITGVWRI